MNKNSSKFEKAYRRIINESAGKDFPYAIKIELPEIDEDNDIIFYDNEGNEYHVSDKQYEAWGRYVDFLESVCDRHDNAYGETSYWYNFDEFNDETKATLSKILNKEIPAMGETVASFISDGEYTQVTDEDVKAFVEDFGITDDL